MPFEKYNQPLAPIPIYIQRLFKTFALCTLAILLALGIGIWGYHRFEKLSYIDSFLNAAMILSSMGPAEIPTTFEGKLFAGLYALFSGLIFIVIIGVMFSPVIHRIFHKWHIG